MTVVGTAGTCKFGFAHSDSWVGKANSAINGNGGKGIGASGSGGKTGIDANAGDGEGLGLEALPVSRLEADFAFTGSPPVPARKFLVVELDVSTVVPEFGGTCSGWVPCACSDEKNELKLLLPVPTFVPDKFVKPVLWGAEEVIGMASMEEVTDFVFQETRGYRSTPVANRKRPSIVLAERRSALESIHSAIMSELATRVSEKSSATDADALGNDGSV